MFGHDSLDMIRFFYSLNLDIVNKYAHFWAINSYRDDKVAVVCIDLLEARFLK